MLRTVKPYGTTASTRADSCRIVLYLKVLENLSLKQNEINPDEAEKLAGVIESNTSLLTLDLH